MGETDGVDGRKTIKKKKMGERGSGFGVRCEMCGGWCLVGVSGGVIVVMDSRILRLIKICLIIGGRTLSLSHTHTLFCSPKKAKEAREGRKVIRI